MANIVRVSQKRLQVLTLGTGAAPPILPTVRVSQKVAQVLCLGAGVPYVPRVIPTVRVSQRAVQVLALTPFTAPARRRSYSFIL